MREDKRECDRGSFGVERVEDYAKTVWSRPVWAR